VPREKLTRYLLSLTHPVGRYKAIIFRKFGFNEENVELLEALLLEIAQTKEVQKVTSTIYGKKYEIQSEIVSPNGRSIMLKTVWFIKTGTRMSSFVTAYPV
jgi:hypothetical protein